MARRAARHLPSKWAHLPSTRPTPTTLDGVGATLNALSLTDLLTLSALMSAADEPLQQRVPAARTHLNFALRRLFLLSVLRSKAAEYKTALVTPQDMARRWDELGRVDGLHMPEDRDTLHSLLMPLVSNQLRFQNITVNARAQQVYGHLIVSQPQGKKYLNLDEVFARKYGLSLTDLLRFLMTLEAWHAACERAVTKCLQVAPNASSAEVWQELVATAREWRLRQFLFSAERFAQALGIPQPLVDAALACLSAPIEELRFWQDRHMHLGLTDTPGSIPFALEHRPLVRLRDGRYLLPEHTALPVTVSLTVLSLLDEAVTGNQKQAYSDTRGKALENYLLGMMQDAFPAPARVIPERKYRRSASQRIHGPDLLILDPRDPHMVLIEAKATRGKVETAPDPTGPRLKRNYGEAFEALRPHKAGSKIEDLRAGLPEYVDMQADIDRATGRPLVIALVHDMPPRSGRLLGRYLRMYPEDSLSSATYDVLLMDLIELEMVVHRAKTTGHSLRAVLEREIQGVAYERDPEGHPLDAHDPIAEADDESPLYCMRFPEIHTFLTTESTDKA